MKTVDLARVRETLSGKTLVGFDADGTAKAGSKRGIIKGSHAKVGLLKISDSKRGILKVR